jgi:hypothetical protein
MRFFRKDIADVTVISERILELAGTLAQGERSALSPRADCAGSPTDRTARTPQFYFAQHNRGLASSSCLRQASRAGFIATRRADS